MSEPAGTPGKTAVEAMRVRGADADVVHDDLEGPPHHLEGHRANANERMVDWLRSRL